MNRRAFLAASTKVVGVNWALQAAPLALLAIPFESRASVPVALAVAASAASMIAAHNQSDGGLGGILTASLSYHRLAAKQLLQIRVSLEDLTTKVSQLPSTIIELYRLEKLRELHGRIGAGVINYGDQMQTAFVTGANYSTWRNHPNTRREFENIYERVSGTLDELEARGQFDAVTALYLPVAVNVALACRVVLQDYPEVVRGRAARYLRFLDKVGLEEEPLSAASDLRIRGEKFKQMRKQLSEAGFEVPDSDQVVSTPALLTRPIIEDYTPPQIVERKCVPRPRRNQDIPPDCDYKDIYGPPRLGETEEFAVIADVEQRLVSAEGAGHTIRQYSVADKLTAEKYDAMRYPLSHKVERDKPFRVDARTPQARLAAVDSTGLTKAAQPRLDLLKKDVDSLNIELAHIALAASALVACTSTKAALLRAFPELAA